MGDCLAGARGGVRLLLTTGGGYFALTSDEQVVAGLQPPVDQMRAAGYARSEILGAEVTVLNAASALCQGKFSRQRGDGSEISLLTATYLVTDGPAGCRISVLAVQNFRARGAEFLIRGFWSTAPVCRAIRPDLPAGSRAESGPRSRLPILLPGLNSPAGQRESALTAPGRPFRKPSARHPYWPITPH